LLLLLLLLLIFYRAWGLGFGVIVTTLCITAFTVNVVQFRLGELKEPGAVWFARMAEEARFREDPEPHVTVRA